jgi:small subunit ribosomal protein S1
MATHILLREIDLPQHQLEREIDAVFDQSEPWFLLDDPPIRENALVKGRVLRVTPSFVQVDVGYKSEGVIDIGEWYDETAGRIVPPRVGDDVSLLLQSLEDESGSVVVSYRRARAQAAWEEFLATHREGDVITGQVAREVKGGLLVQAGVKLFLPAGQVDLRRPRHIGDYVGHTVECKILQIDPVRHNVVVSRRQLLEEQREQQKQRVLASLEPGQVRKGVVKNLTPFGAFVDLGGIDGLLHVKDLSWGRVDDPHEAVHLDEELEVFVLRVERESGRVSLSRKHLTPNPWENVNENRPIGSEHEGTVTNVTSYGVFVALEPGLEGLVHVSRLGRGPRSVGHTGSFQRGDKVACVVLDIDREHRRLSLGMKHSGSDPWEGAAERYRPGQTCKGKVTRRTGFGVFVELEPGLDGLLHVSELPDRLLEDDLPVGDEVEVKILRVDESARKIGLSRRGLDRAGE